MIKLRECKNLLKPWIYVENSYLSNIFFQFCFQLTWTRYVYSTRIVHSFNWIISIWYSC